jgi:TonB family protein
MNRYALIIVLLGMSTGMVVASDSPKPGARQLLEKAQDKSNIFALPSFELKADIRISDEHESLDGSYTLLWNSPEEWREDIRLPGYSETQIGSKGVVSTKRSLATMPLRIHQLHITLGFGSVLPNADSFAHVLPAADEVIKNVHDRKVNGIKVACVEIWDHEKRARKTCVDSSTGMLVRDRPFADRDHIEIEGKVLPRFLSYVEKGKAIVEVQIKELKTGKKFPPSSFVLPDGAVSRAGCMNPMMGRLDNRVQPKYPEADRQSLVQGTVAIYTLVGADGVPRELNVVSSVSPGLNQSSLDAIRQWRYTPATCGGIAVPVETVLVVNYSLRTY